MYVRLARDGKLAPDQLTAEPRSAGLFIDDGTGFVSASTPTNEVIDASPVTAWTSNDSGMTTSVAGGTISPNRAGRFLLQWSAGSILSGNASVVTIRPWINGAARASTAAGGGDGAVILTMAGTAVVMSAAGSCLVDLVVGDTVALAVTGTVGTVTIKKLQFTLTQVKDASVPTPT